MIRSLAFVLVAAPLFAADQSCPWLNAATAAGVLGGPVRSKATATACEFARGRSKLRIEVRTLPAAHEALAHQNASCAPLKAIGNEAFLCAKSHEVVGRVRDQLFKIQLTTEKWQTGAQDIAEAVAGALF